MYNTEWKICLDNNVNIMGSMTQDLPLGEGKGLKKGVPMIKMVFVLEPITTLIVFLHFMMVTMMLTFMLTLEMNLEGCSVYL